MYATVLYSSLNLNQSYGNALICKVSDEFASFCIANYVKWLFSNFVKIGKGFLFDSFFIKTSKILYDLSLQLHYV